MLMLMLLMLMLLHESKVSNKPQTSVVNTLPVRFLKN